MKGEMTAAVWICCERSESVLHVQRVRARRKGHQVRPWRFSLDVKKHFALAKTVQCWDRLPGQVLKAFSHTLDKHQSERHRWPWPGAEEWTRWLLDALSSVVFSVVLLCIVKLSGVWMHLHIIHPLQCIHQPCWGKVNRSVLKCCKNFMPWDVRNCLSVLGSRGQRVLYDIGLGLGTVEFAGIYFLSSPLGSP